MAPNNILATALVWAREPGTRPVRTFAKLISRIAIPPLFMIFPAKMKNGMANNVKMDIPEKIRWVAVSTVAPKFSVGRIARMDEIPRETAMGTPASSMTIKTMAMIRPENNAILI